MIGTQIGRYRIDGELGRGGMGVVFRGTQITLDRTVAIKMLPAHLADGDNQARFRREALTLALEKNEVGAEADIDFHRAVAAASRNDLFTQAIDKLDSAMRNGITVARRLKRRLGLAPEHTSCHTTEVDGYVVEGHLPAQEIDALIAYLKTLEPAE